MQVRPGGQRGGAAGSGGQPQVPLRRGHAGAFQLLAADGKATAAEPATAAPATRNPRRGGPGGGAPCPSRGRPGGRAAGRGRRRPGFRAGAVRRCPARPRIGRQRSGTGAVRRGRRLRGAGLAGRGLRGAGLAGRGLRGGGRQGRWGAGHGHPPGRPDQPGQRRGGGGRADQRRQRAGRAGSRPGHRGDHADQREHPEAGQAEPQAAGGGRADHGCDHGQHDQDPADQQLLVVRPERGDGEVLDRRRGEVDRQVADRDHRRGVRRGERGHQLPGAQRQRPGQHPGGRAAPGQPGRTGRAGGLRGVLAACHIHDSSPGRPGIGNGRPELIKIGTGLRQAFARAAANTQCEHAASPP